MTRQPLALLGPTASGKSAVAMALATSDVGRELGIELVSIDAMQVYRGMDIGTAKPTEAERDQVVHHLIDLVDADESFTVAQFQAEYRRVLESIVQRAGVAVLVGGTGLYLRAIVDDLHLPGTWPEVRARLEDEAARVGPRVLHERLNAVDPQAAQKMEPTNVRRIVRALEVCEGSGRRFSSFGPGVDHYPPSEVRQFALRWHRDALRQRITQRVEQMVDAGLAGEVEALLTRGMSLTARQALGYKEMISHLEGESTLQEATETIARRTMQFAVRQERWFRRDPRIVWFDVERDPVEEVTPRILELLA